MVKTNFLIILLIGSFSFFANFIFASRGVFPVDTFIHYDTGYRILLGELPVRDFWIVHGFIIDLIQSFFFFVLGNNWYAYIFHSSIFNSIIAIFSFYIFYKLKINNIISFFFSICIGLLAYPVSGTPFLDLHSTYFSLIAIYLIILSFEKEKFIYWFYASIFLCLGFFSKQVPAAYLIILLTLLNFYICIIKKNINYLFYFLSGSIFFLIILFFFLIFNNIKIYDFILQVFLFPQSIGIDRYSSYKLHFKNIFLDYKFIYIILIPFLIINIIFFVRDKKYYISNNFFIFLTLLSFVISIIFHQIYTKNQIFIFFIIPILSGVLLRYISLLNLKNFKIYSLTLVIFTIFITGKYVIRFDVDRKFHELIYTKISNASSATQINNKLKGLNWITPYFENAEEELKKINYFISILKKEKNNVMVITEYAIFSSLLEKKLYSPSRTYDEISFPNNENKFFNNYKSFLKKKIIKNEINKIYFFSDNSNFDEGRKIFSYISKDCFKKKILSENIMYLKVLKCNALIN